MISWNWKTNLGNNRKAYNNIIHISIMYIMTIINEWIQQRIILTITTRAYIILTKIMVHNAIEIVWL